MDYTWVNFNILEYAEVYWNIYRACMYEGCSIMYISRISFNIFSCNILEDIGLFIRIFYSVLQYSTVFCSVL